MRCDPPQDAYKGDGIILMVLDHEFDGVCGFPFSLSLSVCVCDVMHRLNLCRLYLSILDDSI